MKEFQFGVICRKNVRVPAPFGLKSNYYKQILLLAETAANDILEVVFVETPPSDFTATPVNLHLLSGSCCLLC